MKTIKRVLVLLIMILVVVIYLTNKDTKIYYVSLGDGLGRGMNANDKIGYGYSDYIKEYLEDIDKLEFYTKQFSDKDKRTTDIINNINDNIEIIEDSKPLTIKKALMHADIITLSLPLYLTLILRYLSLILVSFLLLHPSTGKDISVIS